MNKRATSGKLSDMCHRLKHYILYNTELTYLFPWHHP